MSRVNIDGENPHIFWTTWGVLMKFSGKMWLHDNIYIKKKNRKKNQVLILSLKNILLEKPEEVCQTEPPAFKGLKH